MKRPIVGISNPSPIGGDDANDRRYAYVIDEAAFMDDEALRQFWEVNREAHEARLLAEHRSPVVSVEIDPIDFSPWLDDGGSDAVSDS